MNYKSLRGYLLATSFINIYYEEHKDMSSDLMSIRHQLSIITINTCKKNKININKELAIIWKYFSETVGQDYSVSVLTFCFQLIIKNPLRDKYKMLTSIAIKLNAEKMFSKDEDVRNAKILINKFYAEHNVKKKKEVV